MRVDQSSGTMQGVRQLASPNFDARPDGMKTDLIVVHGISMPPGEFGGSGIDQLFTNSLPAGGHPFFATVAALRVSSHLVIRRDGAVTQYVKFTDRAWHAGLSSFEGRPACNDFSIGIELEGTDTLAYEPVQYEVLAQSIAALCSAYGSLSPNRVVGHSDVAPGRKTDPGPFFDWRHAHRLIARACA